MSDCFVCRKHRGEIELPGGILYEDDLVSSSHFRLAAWPDAPTGGPGEIAALCERVRAHLARL